MISDLRYLLSTFTRRDRVLLGLYVVAQFGLALMDLVGIAIVLPILQLVSGAPLNEGYIGTIHDLLGQPPRQQFVIILTGTMVVAFASKSVLGLIAVWWSTGLVGRLQVRTASRLLRAYLQGSYHDRRGGTLADLTRLIDTGVGDAHSKVLGSSLAILSNAMSTILVLVFLFIVQPIPTLIALLYFGVAVFTMQRLLGGRNRIAGKAAIEASWERAHSIIDVVDGFREIRMHNAELKFAERFDRSNKKAIEVARQANLYGSIPKYALELITIVGIALMLGLSVFTMDADELMTVMGLFVAVAIRLLPTVSGLTAQIGTLRGGQAGLSLVTDELRRLQESMLSSSTTLETRHVRAPRPDRLEPLTIDDLYFRYPDAEQNVFSGISFVVPPGTSIALLGLSGSGKTTLVDLILGLHEYQNGEIRYGNKSIRKLDAEWRDLVAYVPQDVYIANDTVLTNVAFGEDGNGVDENRVIEALRQAHLLDVVESLPEGIHAQVGGRGTRLSGGQRQRLGIARALYRQPSVIVLDEATSALDNKTEREIAQAIESLRGEVTIIQIAHRLSTVRNSDQIFYLEDGRITATGTFDEVREQSEQFAYLVALGNLDADPDQVEEMMNREKTHGG